MTAAHRAQTCEPYFVQPILLAGATLLADPSGVLFWETERVLLVADLHLEKGSSHALRGQFLPPFNSAATLARLAAVIVRYAPLCVIALGDSFHDRSGAARLAETDRDSLSALQSGREWIWLAGNHDPSPPQGCGGLAGETWRLGGLVLRHKPSPGRAPGEIAGHLHPIARLSARGRPMRRRCFVSDGARCVMPAFGAFAGGLNIRDPAFGPYFAAAETTAYVLGAQRLYQLPVAKSLVD